MGWSGTDGVELGAPDSVCHELNAWRRSVPGSMVSYNGVAQFGLSTVKLSY